MPVSQVGQRFGGNVAAMAGLAIDDDVIVQLRADFSMACFDFSKIDVQIRAGMTPVACSCGERTSIRINGF